MRALAVDFGGARIGLAVGETNGATRVLPNLTASGKLSTDARSIDAKAKTEQVDRVVVGLPLESGGVEGRMARVCRKLAAEVAALGWDTAMQDESLTSVEAEAELSRRDLTARGVRKQVDGEAARRILERHFEATRA